MSTRQTTTTPRTRTQPSARPDPGGLWILPVGVENARDTLGVD